MQRLVSGKLLLQFHRVYMQQLITEITVMLHAISDLTRPLEEALVSGKLLLQFHRVYIHVAFV